jgi:GNAT superfamily N-acetyltransferase
MVRRMQTSTQPGLSIRPAKLADQDLVVQMLGELCDELGPKDTATAIKSRLDHDIRQALASSTVQIFIAEVKQQPVGLARADILTADPIFRLREDHRCGYVDQMYVREAFRGQHIGEALLARCEDWFREQRIGHSLLHAAPKAVRFYARHGYQPNREMFKRL